MSNEHAKDGLGSRMKRYEFASKILLTRRSYVIIRIDGCHFHTFTRGRDKPFDENIIDAMQTATQYVCENAQGCKFGYFQSDEASFLLTDFDELTTDAWYDNQLQKLVSVSASMFTATFNQRLGQKDAKLATFDARAFTLPDNVEVMNYFLWRIKDAERNSLAGLCQANYSHKELMNKNSAQQQELLFQKGINWNDVDESHKRGTLIVPALLKWEAIPAPRVKEELLKLIPTKE
jgi:tRNA(His) 5'-end guanylyltransferase